MTDWVRPYRRRLAQMRIPHLVLILTLLLGFCTRAQSYRAHRDAYPMSGLPGLALAGMSTIAIGIPPATGLVLLVALALACLTVHYRRQQQAKQLRRRLADEKDDRAASQAFSSQLLASQERERERIARELHDSLGQNLLVIKNLAFLGAKHSEASAEIKEKFQDISSIATRTTKEVRLISYGLRPDALDHLGLTKSLRAIVNEVADLGTIRFEAAIDDIDTLLAPDLEINLYRVVQEGLNNILKHSHASCARITLRKMEQAICLTIHDNGQGFVPIDGHQQTSLGHGFGMTTVRERIRILGGQLQVNSKHGQGTTIEALIPIPKPSEAMPTRPDSAPAEAWPPEALRPR